MRFIFVLGVPVHVELYREKLKENYLTLWYLSNVTDHLSDELINSDKIHLNENGELTNSESKTAEVLNNFFSIQ